MTGDLRAHPGWSPTHAARDLAPETTGTWGDLSTPENQTNTCPECQHPAGDHTRTGMLASATATVADASSHRRPPG